MQQGRDHEVVRTFFSFFLAEIDRNHLQKRVVGAFETHPKAVTWKIEIVFCGSANIHATRFSPDFYFITILFHVGPSTQQIITRPPSTMDCR